MRQGPEIESSLDNSNQDKEVISRVDNKYSLFRKQEHPSIIDKFLFTTKAFVLL